ncbi:hypothetical protein A2U01_0110452 [Trifolium medium]|uniref:Uncharacterized protein n=1 Tax=Trifolium medium TaxID=97028 RepID=A0A392VLA5_9FABA|nr:hypothetical protein [Trifolium medium]
MTESPRRGRTVPPSLSFRRRGCGRGDLDLDAERCLSRVGDL